MQLRSISTPVPPLHPLRRRTQQARRLAAALPSRSGKGARHSARLCSVETAGSVALLLPLLAWAPLSVSAQNPPAWSLSNTPTFEVGGGDTELYRVRAAVVLPDGRVAIADRGNQRILVVSPSGTVEREIGRKGSGPGEFQMLWNLGSAGDSLLALDTGLRRVTVFQPDGELVRTVPVPVFEAEGVDIQAFVSESRYVATTHPVHFGQPGGLYRDTVAVLLVDGSSGEIVKNLGRRASQYSYHHIQPDGGTTTYRTPFLSTMVMAAAAGRVFMVPLETNRAEIINGDGSDARSVELPVALRAFDRDRVSIYRDSLLAGADPASPSAQRLREVFGDKFPAPEYDPLFSSAHAVGDDVWISTFPVRGSSTRRWFAVDVVAARVAGSLELPADWEVLGGDDTTVLILHRDRFDIEYITAYAYTRGDSP